MLLKEIKNYAKRPVSRDSEYGVDGGTYVGMHFDDKSKEILTNIIKNEKIPNPIDDPEKFHTTLVYSKKTLDGFEANGELEEPWEATIKSFDIFPSKEGNKVLVVKLDCPNCEERHQHANKEYGATYDYDEYIPHVTLSYNVEDNVDKGKLKELTKKYKGHKIYGKEEYTQPIEDNWAINNTN